MTAIMRLYNTYLGPATSAQINLGHVDFRWGIGYIQGPLFLYNDLTLTTDSGTRIGTAAGQKLAFYGTSAIVQPTNSVSLTQALINLGLLAPGAYTVTAGALSGTTVTVSGAASISTLILTSGTNFMFNNDELMAQDNDVVFVV